MGLSKFISFHLVGKHIKPLLHRPFSKTTKKPPWKVLFFGADDFSLFSLKKLNEEYRKKALLSRLEVVTTVKGKANAVKLYADKENLQLHKWPPCIGFGEFDVGIVVSFGHLIPKAIIDQFPLGMLNVHASILPRWRGAAPIIYALANGDTETGVTIMTISPEKFDIGKIVLQESVPIHPEMTQSKLFATLGKLGAAQLIKTLADLSSNLNNAKPQPTEGITYAPKVKPTFASIKWDQMTAEQIYNLGRALEGIFPIQTTWKGMPVKLIGIKKGDYLNSDKSIKPGYVGRKSWSGRQKIDVFPRLQ
ncbi:methionyl-tRNA formyltransferase, mitochondrial isoform X2 [Tribolium castaneum]|uniref:Methionyl-tRNA formyltransferase, mitochondrial n=1 Tax=Tribolium castaneum TaxID=7070 RepID=D6W8W2_TRICA|nr:PREDICTED: methionyl-tRNA formyltransferase, mitochondrial isoform X2 [Tribolium castaneum]EEZ98405.2 Methionyl-tRNA formyltransferase, mitochondrial-like Protein [Tribolium castaneum]|eukprot:XP_008201415.1 PREDICTED: methionyl-tRNA formyltransferase, mitochondrial isoform X2 [Tribolium castaneum]